MRENKVKYKRDQERQERKEKVRNIEKYYK
jgi:hypothetical protein